MAEQTYNFDGIAAAPPPPVPGSERTRVDTNVVGIDHDKILQGIANWASTLPEKWQRPAAMVATLPADALASLVEMFSSPEGVAAAGAKPAMAAMDAAGSAAKNAPGAALRGVAGIADTVSPDVVGIVSPRAGKLFEVAQKVRDASLRAKGGLSAAEEAQLAKQGYSPATIAKIKTQATTPAPATAASAPPAPAAPVAPIGSAPVAPVPPIEVPPPPAASAPPPAAPPASAAPAPSPEAPPPANGLPDQRALNEAALAVHRAAYQRRLAAQASAQVSEMPSPAAAAPAANVKLSAVETKAFLDLMKRGLSGPDAMKNVLMQRSLVEQLGTPTPMGADTRFPKGMRGKPYQP